MIPRFIVSCPMPHPRGFAAWMHDLDTSGTFCMFVDADRATVCKRARTMAAAEDPRLAYAGYETEPDAYRARAMWERERAKIVVGSCLGWEALAEAHERTATIYEEHARRLDGARPARLDPDGTADPLVEALKHALVFLMTLETPLRAPGEEMQRQAVIQQGRKALARPARLDPDGTAEPRTKLVGRRPENGQCGVPEVTAIVDNRPRPEPALRAFVWHLGVHGVAATVAYSVEQARRLVRGKCRPDLLDLIEDEPSAVLDVGDVFSCH